MSRSYPVDVSHTFSVWDVSLGQIVRRGQKWPRADGGEVIGQDPNEVWLDEILPVRIDADPRLYIMEEQPTVDLAALTHTIERVAIARPVEEQVIAVQQEEARRLGDVVEIERLLLDVTLVVGALAEVVLEAQTLPDKVRADVEMFKKKTTTIWENRAVSEAKQAAALEGQIPVLDSGWRTVAAEEEAVPIEGASVRR